MESKCVPVKTSRSGKRGVGKCIPVKTYRSGKRGVGKMVEMSVVKRFVLATRLSCNASVSQTTRGSFCVIYGVWHS